MDYNWEDINKLYSKGLITGKDRSALRMNVIKEQNQFSGIHTKFINNLVEDATKGWADLVVSLKPRDTKPGGVADFFLGKPAEAALNAFALLTLTPVITAAGRASGQQLQDVLLSHGASPQVTAIASALLDAGAQLRTGQGIAKVSGVLPKFKDVVAWLEEPGLLRKLSTAIPDSLVPKAAAIVEKQNPKNLVDVIRPGQDTALPGKGGKMVGERKLLSPPQELPDETAARAMKSQEETHDLLGKVMETLRPRELTETEKTLEAAMASIRGGSTAEQSLNAATQRRVGAAADDLLERMKQPGAFLRGGGPTGQDYIDAGKRAQASYDEGKRVLEMGKTKIADIEELARTMVGKNLDDLKLITPGDPVDPLEIISNSMAVKDHAQELQKLIVNMRGDWQSGNKDTFYKGLAEFYRILEVDPNYRMPLQTAGQSLRAAGDPAVNSTRYLDKITDVGSWLNGEKLGTVNELEANALNIIGRLEQIPTWEKAALWAKNVAAQPAEKLIDPSFRDYARFYFVNNIMSSTDTIGRNVAGSLMAAPWHYAEKMTGVAAAKALNPFLSAQHHIEAGYASEANAFISTWSSTMWDASRYMLTKRWDKLAEMVPEAARHELFRNRFDLPKFSTTGTTNPIPGVVGNALGAPVSISQMADEVARVAVYRGAVSERLRHEWLASGSKISWGQFREQGLMNVAPDMNDYGVRMAGLMTYTDDMSAFGRSLNFVRANIPGTEFVQPFVHTFDRLMAYQWNRAPGLSLLSSKTLSELKSGDPLVRQEMVGRLFLSNIAGAGLFLMARGKAPDGETFLTGGGPVDRALAKSLRESEVIHPYTMWTPYGRMPFRLAQPAGGVLGFIADTAEIWDQLKEPEATGIWSGMVLAGTRTFFDNTYSGIFGMVTALADNPTGEGFERYLRTQGTNIAKGMIPFSGLIRQGLRLYDPTVKDIRSDPSIQDPITRELYGAWWELTREVPGYGAPAKINPRTGQPVMNPPRLLEGTPAGWFLPTAPIQVDDDAVRSKFLELKMPFPQPPQAYGGSNPSQSSFAYSGPLGPAKEAGAGIPYTPEQQNKLKRYMHEADESGATADQEVKTLLADPEFHKLSPVVQQEQIYAVYNSRIDRAVGRVREEHPDLDEKLEYKRQVRGELRMSPEEREGFESEINSTPDPINQRTQEEPIDFQNPALTFEEPAGPAQ